MLLLQEYIKLGQRIKSFTVDAWVGSNWKTVGDGNNHWLQKNFKIAAR